MPEVQFIYAPMCVRLSNAYSAYLINNGVVTGWHCRKGKRKSVPTVPQRHSWMRWPVFQVPSLRLEDSARSCARKAFTGDLMAAIDIVGEA